MGCLLFIFWVFLMLAFPPLGILMLVFMFFGMFSRK